MSEPALTRRGFLLGGCAVVAGAVAVGVAGCTTGGTGSIRSAEAQSTQPVWRTFPSNGLAAPTVTSETWGAPAPGYIFVDPHSSERYTGLIMENSGEPVWIEPTGLNLTDLRVQRYQGKPVLTYWSGKDESGHGAGFGTILDTSYRPVAEVHAGNGIDADMHEFNLTSRGTALVTAYPIERADISSFGGNKSGYIFNCHVQEIDVATGNVLLDWSAKDHIEMSESYRNIGDKEGHDGSNLSQAFDPFHLNAVDDDGDTLLISSRYTHAIYSIDRVTGDVQWRFGGRNSDFAIADEARFAWQHDVRRHTNGTISLFDNHRDEGTKGTSRGLVFDLDEAARIATLKHTYSHDSHLGIAMGSVQLLDGGNVLVGWGTDPATTEFTEDGTPVYEARHIGSSSYRATRSIWKGQPDAVPDAVVVWGGGDTMTVHASWNGATEVAGWGILTGSSANGLHPTKAVAKSGYETSGEVAVAAKTVVVALDASGKVLGTSAVHSL